MAPAPAAPRIALNASSIVGPRTGIGRATSELCQALLRIWPEPWPAPLFWINTGRHGRLPEDPWLREHASRLRTTRLPGKLLLRGWQYLGLPKIETLTGPIDLFHALDSYIPATRAARTIVTVHDLYFLHAPEHVDAYGGGYFRETFPSGLPAAAALSSVSAFTRDELLKHYALDPDKLHIVPHGVDHALYRTEPDPQDAPIRAAIGMDAPYLLCVATLEPRKNLARLIAAYARAREQGTPLPPLAVAGGRGWGMQSLESIAAAAGVAGSVRALGYVPESKLPALYRGAQGLIFPSLYEGFGLPALEAMACGCPTLLARAGSLSEVGADAAAYLDPLDEAGMAKSICDFAVDMDLRQRMAEAGKARAAGFTWERAARSTLEIYRRALPSVSGAR